MSDRILTLLVMRDAVTDMDDVPFNQLPSRPSCLSLLLSWTCARIAIADMSLLKGLCYAPGASMLGQPVSGVSRCNYRRTPLRGDSKWLSNPCEPPAIAAAEMEGRSRPMGKNENAQNWFFRREIRLGGIDNA